MARRTESVSGGDRELDRIVYPGIEECALPEHLEIRHKGVPVRPRTPSDPRLQVHHGKADRPGGLNERDAGRLGIAVRVATLPMSAVLRKWTMAETHGFMKALVEVQSDRILGFTMLGPEAGEVIAFVQTAMLAGLPYTGLRDAILTHPTMAEGLGSLFTNVPPNS